MKNDSPIYPFDLPGDEYFDSNNNGELKGLETIARDAHWTEQSNNQEEKDVFNQTYHSTTSSSSSSTTIITIVTTFIGLVILAAIVSALDALRIDMFLGSVLLLVIVFIEFIIHVCTYGRLTSAPKVFVYMFSMVAAGALLMFLAYLYKYGFHHFYEVINGLEQSEEAKYRLMRFKEDDYMNTFYVSLIADGFIFILDGVCSVYKLAGD